MPRRLLGFNKLFTIKRRQRVIKASGSVGEAEAEVLAEHVPGTMQPHTLSNLPPMGELARSGGLMRKDEWKLWLGDVASTIEVLLDDLVEEEGTDPLRVYRVLAVLDEAGRGHHQYLRVESYSQQSVQWKERGDG